MKFEFLEAPHPVILEDGEDLLPVVTSVFRHWPFRTSASHPTEAGAIVATRTERGYGVDTPWLEQPRRYSDPVNLACGLAVLVNHSMLSVGEGRLCLHGAGVQIGGRIVVFPNYYRAGKSTLTVCLAAAGARIFSDDILPVLPDDRCMALGISPRLRRPLPDSIGARTGAFVEAHSGVANKQYLYVEPGENRQARFGVTAPFGGFVLLDRKESGPSRLAPVSAAEVLKQLVLRNFARQVSVDESLKRLHGLVSSLPCYRLTYSNGDEAANLVMERFAETSESLEPSRASDTEIVQSSPAPSEHPRRRPGVGERYVDGELFLVNASGESIFHLNPIGAGLWRLMDGGCAPEEAAAVLREAFPDIEAGRIERDVATLIRDLQARGLLEKRPKTALVAESPGDSGTFRMVPE